MNTQPLQMTLETNKFRELMREAYDLCCLSLNSKYDLRSVESLREYDFWAPYVLNSSGTGSKGFKLLMIDLMSILLVMKDGVHDKERYIVRPEEIKEIYKNNPLMEIKNQPNLEVEIQSQKKLSNVHGENVIDFSLYKKRNYGVL